MPVTTYVSIDGLVAHENRAGTVRTYRYDGWGSTSQMVNTNGDVTDSFEFDYFGNQIARTGTTNTPFRWLADSGYNFNVSNSYLDVLNSSVYSSVLGIHLSSQNPQIPSMFPPAPRQKPWSPGIPGLPPVSKKRSAELDKLKQERSKYLRAKANEICKSMECSYIAEPGLRYPNWAWCCCKRPGWKDYRCCATIEVCGDELFQKIGELGTVTSQDPTTDAGEIAGTLLEYVPVIGDAIGAGRDAKSICDELDAPSRALIHNYRIGLLASLGACRDSRGCSCVHVCYEGGGKRPLSKAKFRCCNTGSKSHPMNSWTYDIETGKSSYGGGTIPDIPREGSGGGGCCTP